MGTEKQNEATNPQPQELPDDLCRCPVCGAVVPEEQAGRICPVNGCYPQEAGGWQ